MDSVIFPSLRRSKGRHQIRDQRAATASTTLSTATRASAIRNGPRFLTITRQGLHHHGRLSTHQSPMSKYIVCISVVLLVTVHKFIVCMGGWGGWMEVEKRQHESTETIGMLTTPHPSPPLFTQHYILMKILLIVLGCDLINFCIVTRTGLKPSSLANGGLYYDCTVSTWKCS